MADAKLTFLSHAGCVLVCLARDPHQRLREIAVRVGITERAVQSIIADSVAAGLVSTTRVGRRNQYALHLDVPVPGIESQATLAETLALLAPLGGGACHTI